MIKLTYDVVIVGTGAAGLFAALSLNEKKQILMISKDSVENSDSYLAQGGISTLKDPTDYKAYFEDTMRAGHYENKEESVKIMIEDSPQMIEDLIQYGVEFDRNDKGELSFTREAAHSTFRILHHEDLTGKEITSKLIDRVREKKNISMKPYTTMIDLISKQNRCHGIIVEKRNGERQVVFAKQVVLATGGLGGLFKHSTNFSHITGDSFALALKHRIVLEHMNYIQIHPTTLYTQERGRSFLISESVRGEGAVLLNKNHRRFVNELLPRDTVANAIQMEMERLGTDYVYLSMRSMEKKKIQARFPNIYKRCLEEGYDLASDLVPVTPAQHYVMGGIQTNVNGETSMVGLYAVGETACNGVHGANRLASNSLLESLVFAKRTAYQIEKDRSDFDTEEFEPEVLDTMSKEERELVFKKMILEEIRRKDEGFYVKWCNDEN
ncbi:L-aspartate oxidase [Anaeromicropila populeti]|uniref:L-aspartate oxidase n=1 Tax=Anaeromicropila populeti TaxID=37658 RepID=A0A1I6KRV7_9FIRM|nr:L-aspartate oxidase [Anaeromicropila populeti]SFR93914.1 L-aspartate oxidase [Anaeromicropila populeti]